MYLILSFHVLSACCFGVLAHSTLTALFNLIASSSMQLFLANSRREIFQTNWRIRFQCNIHHQASQRGGNAQPSPALHHQGDIRDSCVLRPVAVAEKKRPHLGPKKLGTHTQAWSACSGPASAEGVLWVKGRNTLRAEVHNWRCVIIRMAAW